MSAHSLSGRTTRTVTVAWMVTLAEVALVVVDRCMHLIHLLQCPQQCSILATVTAHEEWMRERLRAELHPLISSCPRVLCVIMLSRTVDSMITHIMVLRASWYHCALRYGGYRRMPVIPAALMYHDVS